MSFVAKFQASSSTTLQSFQSIHLFDAVRCHLIKDTDQHLISLLEFNLLPYRFLYVTHAARVLEPRPVGGGN